MKGGRKILMNQEDAINITHIALPVLFIHISLQKVVNIGQICFIVLGKKYKVCGRRLEMTPVEFANKYLSPPERVRYIKNISSDNWMLDSFNYNLQKHDFIENGFEWNRTPEGINYWHKIKHAVRKRKVGWFNDTTRIRR